MHQKLFTIKTSNKSQKNPIPKSTSNARQIQNLDIFDFYLESEDLHTIDNLTKSDGRLKDQDPAEYEEF